MREVVCVDLFCGAGGLTHGFVLEGIPVAAGIDLDPACRYPYEANNQTAFVEKDVSKLTAEDLNRHYGEAKIKILAGCAPCQPFSSYAQRYDEKRDNKWSLLEHFSRLAEQSTPDVITMENVPKLAKHKVFEEFVGNLERLGYFCSYSIVDCSKYGVPQTRKRLVLLASKFGKISFVEETHSKPKTLKQVIGKLRPLQAGESAPRDRLHTAAPLSPLNMKRIRASIPGGTWRDWPRELVANCHRGEKGRSYSGVYGRMDWSKPGPTMTTQCFGFGNGRFGHPEQDRAITLREAAIIQSFPRSYKFLKPGEQINFTLLGRLIGNAVPVELGRAIAASIRSHLESVEIT